MVISEPLNIPDEILVFRLDVYQIHEVRKQLFTMGLLLKLLYRKHCLQATIIQPPHCPALSPLPFLL
jgi:hypothetical protein